MPRQTKTFYASDAIFVGGVASPVWSCDLRQVAPGGSLHLLTLMAVGRLSLAASPPSIAVHIDFETPPRCADADAFYLGLAARMERVRRAAAGEAATRLKVRLARAGTRVHGELQIVGAHFDSDTRVVEGATCQQVVEALSLTAALALDPSTQARPPTTAAGSAAAVPPGSKAGAASAPASPPEPLVVATPLPAASASIAVDLGARAVAVNAASPSVGVGGALFLRISRRQAEGTAPSLAVAALHAPNDLLQGNAVVVRWTAVALTVCPGWGIGRAIVLEGCAQATGGRLSVEDRGITNPSPTASRWWGNAGLAGRAWMPISARITAELEATLGVPLVHRRFVTTTPERVVAETPGISALLAFGIAYRF